MKHANVAFFVPHLGCPHACSFCNQHAIAGQPPPTPEDVERVLSAALPQLKGKEAQVAFFGGSFTAVEPAYRRALLRSAQPFLGSGKFAGIRVSTRPDCVDNAILGELRECGVTAVELGAQCMDDAVLRQSRRGHTAGDTKRAADFIRQSGMELGLQMMTGLPGDTPEGAWNTARALAALQPDTVRIYPVLVLKGTELEKLYGEKRYHPQSLEEAVELCAGLLGFFAERGIPVIRLGLHDAAELDRSVLAGPRHPAFRELCESRILLQRAVRLADIEGLSGPVELRVHPRSVSKMVGQHRCNMEILKKQGILARVRPDPSVDLLDVSARRAAAGG